MTDGIPVKDETEALQSRIVEAAASGDPLQIVGGGSKSFYGNCSEGDDLEVAEHSGVIDYDPAELVITLRGGCRLADVEALLAEHRQMFAFEAPHFAETATIGGMIASGLSGPRRAYAGAIRDYLLGVKILDGRGEVLNFGGRVIKNVAGFDVSRLMAGAMGTLGVILEVSLRVVPCFEREVTLSFEHDSVETHLNWVNQVATKPLPLSASMWCDGLSRVRLSGSNQGVDSAMKQLGGDSSEGNWTELRELRHAFFADQSHIMRLNLPATEGFSLQQAQLVEWGGAKRWICSDSDIERLRERAADKRGQLTLFRGGQQDIETFQPLDAASLALHRSLKSKFDPARIFNRNRLFTGL